MSSQPCSLVLELEEAARFDQHVEQPFALFVNKRYGPFMKESAIKMTSQDVVELGGSLTISF